MASLKIFTLDSNNGMQENLILSFDLTENILFLMFFAEKKFCIKKLAFNFPS